MCRELLLKLAVIHSRIVGLRCRRLRRRFRLVNPGEHRGRESADGTRCYVTCLSGGELADGGRCLVAATSRDDER